jgi:membrane associated rhomboid family serine protease
MKLTNEIRIGFAQYPGLYRLIFINVVFFIALGFVRVFSFLTGIGGFWPDIIIETVAMRSSVQSFLEYPWSVITYMFVHEGFFHILFNMLVLFWFGKIFCTFIKPKKLVTVYLLGGITGALAYMISFNLLPPFAELNPFSRLIGASAGVIAILTAAATMTPNYSVMLLFFGMVRLKWIALVMVLLYFLSIPQGNAGGNISHIGGALFGFIYVKGLRSGIDLGSWLDWLLESTAGIFQRRGSMKTVHRSKPTLKRGIDDTPSRQEKIDTILDKISRSGYSSLSSDEKEFLFQISNKNDTESKS